MFEIANARVSHAVSVTGKTIAARVFTGGDLHTSIEEICKANGIKHNYVHSFGSFCAAACKYMIPMEAKIDSAVAKMSPLMIRLNS